MTDANGDNAPLLEVHDLHTRFHTEEGVVPAVDGVTWSARRGETLAIVGESGCGKSVTALSIMRLIPPPGRIVSGRVLLYENPDKPPTDVLALPERRMRGIRGNQIAMIFQEPMSSLNPVFSIGDQIAEAVALHQGLRSTDAMDAAIDMLERVGIAAARQRSREYPHQMSGGMRQRVMIAMALCCDPSLLIADEPTTALDVTVQAQILDLLRDLQNKRDMGIVIITHDLGVVAQIADHVCVMYAGRIVERTDVKELFKNPMHPYTIGLLESLPRTVAHSGRLKCIPGSVPNPAQFPEGCRFHPRCPLTRRLADESPARPREEFGSSGDVLLRCVRGTPNARGGQPDLLEVRPGHFVACWESEGYDAAAGSGRSS